MAKNMLVLLSCGTDNPNRATRAFFIAVVAHKQGCPTCVFLMDDAVFLAKKGMAVNVRAATGDNADDHISYLQEFSVPILVCTPCAISRQITENDLINGARMATAVEFVEMCETHTVVSF